MRAVNARIGGGVRLRDHTHTARRRLNPAGGATLSDLHHAKTIPPDGEIPMDPLAATAYSLARLRGTFVPTPSDMAAAARFRDGLRLIGFDVTKGLRI